jgi:predicted MFS family arabinose efflux permease
VSAPPATIRALTRRLVVLTALRWLPVGLTTPVMVLLPQARGLSLADVGLLFTVYGVVVLALELPTGGLADALGRRAVVVTGALLHVVVCAGFVLSPSLPAFAATAVVMGIGRALDSGPVEAWYVDAVHALDRRADVAPGLAQQSAADGGGLAVGAALGGTLPALLGGWLAAPFVVSAVLDVVFLVAVLRLMGETRPPRTGSARAALATGLRAVPATLGGAVRLSATDRGMRLVLLVTAAGAVGLVAFELLGPGRFAELAGGPEQGAAVLGVVQSLAFGTAALGALLAPSLRGLLRGSTRVACACLALLAAAGLTTFGTSTTVLLAGGTLCGFYLAHGAQWPLLSSVLHSRVTTAQRATAVSAMSLSLSVGGILGNLVLPRLDAAFLVAGVVLVVSALVCLRLPSPDQEALLDEPLDDGQHLLGGLTLAQPGAGGEHAQQLAEPAGAVAAGEQRRTPGVDHARPPQP